MATVSNANSYYTNSYTNSNTQNKSSNSKTTSAEQALKNYTNQNSSSSSSSNDFLSSRIDAFNKQSEQYMALAKSKLTSKNAITSDMQNLFKAINTNDFTKMQTAFDNLTSHLDEKKLTSKVQSLLDKLEDLIDDKNSKGLKNAFYDISHNSNALANAYTSGTTKTPTTTQPSTVAKAAIASDLRNLEKAVNSGKEADITKAFNTLDKHINESKLDTTTKTLLSNFENTIDDKDSKKLKGYLTDLQKASTTLAGAFQNTTTASSATQSLQQKLLESMAKNSYSSLS